MMTILDRPYLGLVHRLNRPVGGVMVYAKNKKANSNLSTQVSQRKLHKEYLVVVCGKPEFSEGKLRNYLKKLRTINMNKVVNKDTIGAKEAILEYEDMRTRGQVHCPEKWDSEPVPLCIVYSKFYDKKTVPSIAFES